MKKPLIFCILSITIAAFSTTQASLLHLNLNQNNESGHFRTPAAQKQKKAKKQKEVTAPQTTETQATKPFWDRWYTITVRNVFHYAIYNERFEKRSDGKIFHRSQYWKNEEGYTNEEQIGALSNGAPDYFPLFFNFHSMYRTTEKLIDGNISEQKKLSVKIRQGNPQKKEELPTLTHSIPKNSILSTFFPLWAAEQIPNMKINGKTANFSVLLEDGAEPNFQTFNAQMTQIADDEFSKKMQAKKFQVRLNDIETVWYFNTQLVPIRVFYPSQQMSTDLVSNEEEAQKFFKQESKK